MRPTAQVRPMRPTALRKVAAGGAEQAMHGNSHSPKPTCPLRDTGGPWLPPHPWPQLPSTQLGVPAQGPGCGHQGALHWERQGEPQPPDRTAAGQRALMEAGCGLSVVFAPSRAPDEPRTGENGQARGQSFPRGASLTGMAACLRKKGQGAAGLFTPRITGWFPLWG